MKAFKVDMDGIEEVEMPEDFIMASDFDWDCVPLGNGHDAWVRDDALSEPDLAVATVGGRPDVPLPAYLLGAAGERTVSATLSLDDVRGLVTSMRRIR